MKLESEIQKSRDILYAHLKNLPLDAETLEGFEKFKKEYYKDTSAFFRKSEMLPGTVGLNVDNSRENLFLDQSDLSDFVDNGVLCKKIEIGQELKQKLEAELSDFYFGFKNGTYDNTVHLHWTLPSVMEFISANKEYINKVTSSLMNADLDQMMIDTQIFYIEPDKGSTLTHSDYTALPVFQYDKMQPSVLNWHIDISGSTTSNSLVFYPGTHKDIVYGRTAFKELKALNGSVDEEVALKGIYLSESADYRKALSLEGRVLEEETGTFIPDLVGGLYPFFEYKLAQFKNGSSQRGIEGVDFLNEVCNAKVFATNIIHGSHTNTEDTPRISLSVRFMKVPSFVFKYGWVYQNSVVDFINKYVYDFGLDMLNSLTVKFEDVLKRLPSGVSKLSESKIIETLFGKQDVKLDSKVALLLAVQDNGDSNLPFTTFSRLEKLFCLSGELETKDCVEILGDNNAESQEHSQEL